MWKRNKYFFIIGIFIISILIIEYNKPKPINWFESFSKYDKIPYGNNILFNELSSIFTQSTHTASENIEKSLQNNLSAINYLFINNTFRPEENDVNELLNFVSEGNNAMIVSRLFDENLLDTLGLSIKQTLSLGINDSLHFYLGSNKQNYYHKFTTSLMVNSFSYDSIREFSKLGYVSDTLLNFVKVPFGKGHFYMHLNPLVFTNFYMLNNDNHRYISAVLSHLPNEYIIWDEYYKNRKNAINKSQLYIITSTSGLRQAIYLTVISILVYMLFASKRKQRIIPVAIEKSNDTLNFVRTIGQLYYNEKNNKDIGMKRIEFFLSHIRKQYHIFSDKLDDDFCIKLHQSSGVPLDEIKKIAVNFNIIKGVQDISNERIIEQDSLIDSFNKKTRYNG